MRAIILSVAVWLWCASAYAMTVDFSGVSNAGALATSYSENGVSAQTTNGILAYHANPSKVHLHAGAGDFASSITFSMSGRFDAIQFDANGLNKHCYNLSCGINGSEAYNNIQVIGKRGTDIVGMTSFYSEIFETTHIFGSDFTNLDSLTIKMLLPSNYQSSTCGFFTLEICSAIDMDNLELRRVDVAQTPLPAGLPLYAAGIAIIGYVVRRRRKKTLS